MVPESETTRAMAGGGEEYGEPPATTSSAAGGEHVWAHAGEGPETRANPAHPDPTFSRVRERVPTLCQVARVLD